MSGRWVIVYASYCRAVEYIYGVVAGNTTYLPVCININDADENILGNNNIIMIGKNPPKEGYVIDVSDNKLNKEYQVIYISGADDINTLYAAVDFENKYLVYSKNADEQTPIYYFNKLFEDRMKEYHSECIPEKKERALWTWGHCIFDYRKYIDNMVKLKLNMLFIWNDYPPVNASELVKYAHLNGIEIIWGFAWGWTPNCNDSDINDIEGISESIIHKYKKEYLNLEGDGIYFQSFTETSNDKLGDNIIASKVTELVNITAKKMYEISPTLEIYFGLHATSVKNRLEFIEQVDKRISIIWEDCGAFPYSYMPGNIGNFEETKEFTRKILKLRDCGKTGAILKGNICLDWSNFEHQQGSFIIGEYKPEYIKKISVQKAEIWKYIQAYWMINADKALDIINMFGENNLVACLVEDGAFEEKIHFSVALFAEMLWDSKSDIKDLILKTAMAPFVKFD